MDLNNPSGIETGESWPSGSFAEGSAQGEKRHTHFDAKLMNDSGKRRKVVHFTSVHSPLDNRIARKECAALLEAGFDVALVARHDEAGEVGEIPLISVPIRAGRWARMTRSVWEVSRAAHRVGAEYYHFHDPELLPIGVWLA